MLEAYGALSRALEARDVQIPMLRASNLQRSVFHVGSAISVVLLLEVFLSREGGQLAAAGFVTVAWGLELVRRFSERFNTSLMRSVRGFSHPHEHHRVNSATWYGTALLLLSLLGPTYATAVGVAVLGMGDPVAAFVGRRFGRRVLYRGRTLEGTFAFFLSAAVASMLVLVVFHSPLGLVVSAVIATVSAAVGAVVELVSVRLDDNFTIPLAAALAAYVTFVALA
jgi:dolichol kinase